MHPALAAPSSICTGDLACPALSPEQTSFLRRRGKYQTVKIKEQRELSCAPTLPSDTFPPVPLLRGADSNILRRYEGMKQKPSTLSVLSRGSGAASRALGQALPLQGTESRRTSVRGAASTAWTAPPSFRAAWEVCGGTPAPMPSCSSWPLTAKSLLPAVPWMAPKQSKTARCSTHAMRQHRPSPSRSRSCRCQRPAGSHCTPAPKKWSKLGGKH